MRTTIVSGLLLACATAVAADVPRNSVVYIECTTQSDQLVRGTGVIVSDAGRVLTAKHVAVDRTSQCYGVRGTSAERPNRKLVWRKQVDEDAVLLEFNPREGETFEPLEYLIVERDMKGNRIQAHGFPPGSAGQASLREGVLSTTFANNMGLIETDAMTARGMSGGPVVMDGKLIGIVAGARFDTNGAVTDYGVLLAEYFARPFDMVKAGAVSKTREPDSNPTVIAAIPDPDPIATARPTPAQPQAGAWVAPDFQWVRWGNDAQLAQSTQLLNPLGQGWVRVGRGTAGSRWNEQNFTNEYLEFTPQAAYETETPADALAMMSLIGTLPLITMNNETPVYAYPDAMAPQETAISLSGSGSYYAAHDMLVFYDTNLRFELWAYVASF